MVNVDCFFMFVQMKKFMRGIRVAADTATHTAHRTPDIEYRVSPSIRVVYIEPTNRNRRGLYIDSVFPLSFGGSFKFKGFQRCLTETIRRKRMLIF